MPVIGSPTTPANLCITLGDVSSRVATLLGSDAQLSIAEVETIAVARYALMHDANAWSKRRKNFKLNLVAPVSNTASQTVTVTQGLSTITSAGTPFTSAMDGRQIRIGAEQQYFYFNYVSTSSGTLEDGNGNAATWARATDTAAGWTIFQSVYALPSDADVIISLASNYPLREFDGGRAALDAYDPDRLSRSSDPTHWIYAGANSDCVRLIEVWPFPSIAKTLSGQYFVMAPSADADTVIAVHQSPLTYGVAADCFNMLFAKTGDPGYEKMGLFYEKKYTESLNDIVPWEISKNSPPRTIQKSRKTFGRGTDWEASHDLDIFDHIG